jgi:hypothetical protein
MGQMLPTKSVRERYQVNQRTIDRWLDDEKLNFPRPILVNNRRYFPLDQLEAWEISRVRIQPAPPRGVAAKPRPKTTKPVVSRKPRVSAAGQNPPDQAA